MNSAPEISRANPASFMFLIDQSGSMEQKLAGQADGINKMNAAADAVNRTIQAVAITSTSASSATTPTTKALPPCPHRHQHRRILLAHQRRHRHSQNRNPPHHGKFYRLTFYVLVAAILDGQ